VTAALSRMRPARRRPPRCRAVQDGDYERRGLCVGIVDKAKIIDGKGRGAGDDTVHRDSASGLHATALASREDRETTT